MLVESVLRYLERGIETVCDSLELPCVILRPNAIEDVGGASPVFAVDARELQTRRDTERSAITSCVGTIVVLSDADSRLELVDASLQALVDLFAPDASRSLIPSGVITEPLFPNGVRRLRIYPSRLRRGNDVIENGRYRTTLLIDLEIEEEMIYVGNE